MKGRKRKGCYAGKRGFEGRDKGMNSSRDWIIPRGRCKGVGGVAGEDGEVVGGWGSVGKRGGCDKN